MTTEIRPSAAHQRPSGRMHLAASQPNLVDSTWTVVELDTISAGFTDGIEDVVNHRITPGVAGFYILTGQVHLYNVIADRNYRAAIDISGGGFIVYSIVHAAIADRVTINCTDLVYLSAADYVELIAYSVAGVDTVDVWRGSDATFLCVQRVR